MKFRIERRFVPAPRIAEGAQVREDFIQWSMDGKTWEDVPADLVVSEDPDPDPLDIEP